MHLFAVPENHFFENHYYFLFHSYIVLYLNLTKRNVLSLSFIAILTIVAAIFEVVTLGALVPFITLLVEPDKLYDFAIFKFLIYLNFKKQKKC